MNESSRGGIRGRNSARSRRLAELGRNRRAARDQPVAEVTDQRLAFGPHAQIPPESVRRASEAAKAAGVQSQLMVTDAQRHQVFCLMSRLLRAELDVVLVQPAARRASRRFAAPVVALENPIAPPPVRVFLVFPGVAQRLDQEQEALPVFEVKSSGGAAGAEGALPEGRHVERTPEGNSLPGPPRD